MLLTNLWIPHVVYLHWYSAPGILQLLLYCTTIYIVLQVVLPGHSQGLYGELSFGFSGEAAVRGAKYPLVHSLHPKIHHRVNNNCVPINARNCLCLADLWWVKKSIFTLHSSWKWIILFCHNARFWYLHGSWFLIVLEFCLSETDMSSSAWSPSLAESWLVNPVDPGSTGSCCFDAELGMPSSQLSVSWLTGNASSTCGTGVGLLLPLLPTAFLPSSCFRLLLIGNR